MPTTLGVTGMTGKENRGYLDFLAAVMSCDFVQFSVLGRRTC